ncbi:Nucleoporin nup84 [Tulasnella sp. 403]|nr:Nucleoporin nup84 [Tulasnella sp. 403]
MLAASPRLNELYIVANWLRDIAPPVQLPDHPPGYRINTKMKLRHGRVGQPGHENLVRAIDPDVLNRESGLSLDPQDAAYEKSLSYTLFACVRAGRLDQAMDICANHEHAWLAAVMRGSLPFRWPAITSRDLTGQVDSDSMQPDPAEVWTGNWRRKLWRQTCLRACSSPTLPVSTRALYASLCLSSQSMTALTPLLKTWEDHLWARSEMLFQDRIANQLEAMGGFWEHGMKIGGHIAPHAVYAVSEDHWSGEVEKVLAEMETIKVEQGLDYRDAIHFAQLNIIMGRTDQLLESFADHLAREDTPQTESRQWAIVVRFYTHLCLFLRLIGYEVSLHATDVILSAYVGILESQGHGQLVALYVGALSENAVDKYASYLSRLDVHLSRSEREAALRRCQDHGLNVGEVAVRTAATIARNVLSRLPRADGPLPDPVTGSVNLTPDEYQLCRSVEWLVYDKSTHDEALNQANRMIRYFLGIGRLATARFMHESLPLDLVRTSPNHDFEIPAAIEFVYYRRFFTLMNEFDKLPRVEEFPENESVPKKAAWKEAFVVTIVVDSHIAQGWEVRMSSSRGVHYFYDPETRQSQWDTPDGLTEEEAQKLPGADKYLKHANGGGAAATGGSAVQVRASHLLVKHRGSRRPSSWKEANITRTKEEAIAILKGYEEQIGGNPETFAKLAAEVSDCSSHSAGGDLGWFGKGQMQKPFEEATYGLKVGQMSGVVETDSGVHLILRTG